MSTIARTVLSAGLWATCCALASVAFAGSFGLSPMRVELSGSAPTAVINVDNSGDAPVTLQAQARDWTQRDGADVYSETRSFIVSPPIFTIPPGKRQVVRVALRGESPKGIEGTHRLVFREVPVTQEAAGGVAFRIAVGMNIPLFVAPSTGPVAPAPVYSLETGPDGVPRIRIANDGNGHLRLANLTVEQGGEALARKDVLVVLPGAFAFVELPKDRVVSDRPVQVRAQSKGGAVDLSLVAARP